MRVGVLLCVVACGSNIPATATTKKNDKLQSGSTRFEIDLAEFEKPPVEPAPVLSMEIIARDSIVTEAEVKHILISWNELESVYMGGQDPRAQKRTRKQAEDMVKSLVGQLRTGASFDEVMKERSEDTGSARSLKVTPDAHLSGEFRQLSLRLKVEEIGVCQTEYGFHIIKRIR